MAYGRPCRWQPSVRSLQAFQINTIRITWSFFAHLSAALTLKSWGCPLHIGLPSIGLIDRYRDLLWNCDHSETRKNCKELPLFLTRTTTGHGSLSSGRLLSKIVVDLGSIRLQVLVTLAWALRRNRHALSTRRSSTLAYIWIDLFLVIVIGWNWHWLSLAVYMLFFHLPKAILGNHRLPLKRSNMHLINTVGRYPVSRATCIVFDKVQMLLSTLLIFYQVSTLLCNLMLSLGLKTRLEWSFSRGLFCSVLTRSKRLLRIATTARWWGWVFCDMTVSIFLLILELWSFMLQSCHSSTYFVAWRYLRFIANFVTHIDLKRLPTFKSDSIIAFYFFIWVLFVSILGFLRLLFDAFLGRW